MKQVPSGSNRRSSLSIIGVMLGIGVFLQLLLLLYGWPFWETVGGVALWYIVVFAVAIVLAGRGLSPRSRSNSPKGPQ
jgi:hypothetical protein